MNRIYHIIVTGLLTLLPLWSFAQKDINEKTALQFLYSTMSLADKADYSHNYYAENVQLSLKARREMPWGPNIPKKIFLHFVLPVRVNNENLDDSRRVLFKELKPLVEHLNMTQAILEVNHWCHEHVTYRPSDARTSSPLATIKTAYGRCGEESTLLVAALRAVGIPARQVYTPRWAHTDDNHAWVEAWADGQWKFLGACEPEPVLNLGWFNQSASRGMLMHTKVAGDYHGPEEVISRTPYYTEINVVRNYAPATTKTIQVVNAQGHPVVGATVEMKIYNYAEFFTVARKETNADGCISLSAGHGDLLAWATDHGCFALDKVDFRNADTARIVLPVVSDTNERNYDIVPPKASTQMPPVTAQQREHNNRLMAEEDSVRHAYEATLHPQWRGNQKVIKDFLTHAKNKTMADQLLSVLSPKDLRDITLNVLRDNETAITDTSRLYCRYVLCPRVELEWLVPYKTFFRKHLPQLNTIAKIDNWCRKNIRIDDSQNPQHLRMTPLGVYHKRTADKLSYKIFFVSLARSMGLPSRINEVDGRLQYFKKGLWHTINVREQKVKTLPYGSLQLTWKAQKYLDNPKYYTHFTLSKMVNGSPQLLTYPEEATYGNTFNHPIALEAGKYMLTTGTRMADGSVLSHIAFFTVEPNKMTSVPLILRQSNDKVQVIGSLNAEDIYHDSATDTDRSLLSTAGRNYYVVAIVAPNQEPTNHALRDIALCKPQLEKWGRKIIVLFRNNNEGSRFNHAEFSNLPNTIVWGADKGGKIEDELRKEFHIAQDAPLPIVVITDSFNRVVAIWQGYTIGLGDQLMKVINKL